MCDDPLHDERNEGLWHVWRDDEGRLFAQRCPESVVREKADRERRSIQDTHQGDQGRRREDWRNR
jgi:hypothetical protein